MYIIQYESKQNSSWITLYTLERYTEYEAIKRLCEERNLNLDKNVRLLECTILQTLCTNCETNSGIDLT